MAEAFALVLHAMVAVACVAFIGSLVGFVKGN